MNKKNFKEEKQYQDQVEGRNAVIELLESGRDINKIFVSNGEKNGSINKILAMAKEKRVIVTEVNRKKLEEMATSDNHQGVIAIVPPYEYCDIDDILECAKSRNEDPFILILDGIEDPHNLGAIIRTAETACVNSTVTKVAAGAVEHMNIARVNNINEAIRYLKDNDVWICGTDMDTNTYYYDQDLTGSIGIVIGSEGFGCL